MLLHHRPDPLKQLCYIVHAINAFRPIELSWALQPLGHAGLVDPVTF